MAGTSPAMTHWGYTNNPFAQVVMPTEGFARMVVLFQRALEVLLKGGQLTQSQLDDMRKAVDNINPAVGPNA